MSYDRLSDFEKTKLNEQQDNIIYSVEDKIFVSAGPGSGKTHTICEKIVHNLDNLPEYKGIIACSFTRESSKELLSRVKSKVTSMNTEKSFIGTLDSFVLNEIIGPFKNRFYYECSKDKYVQIENLTVTYPKNFGLLRNLITLLEDASKWKGNDSVKMYVSNWYKMFTAKGEYELSFPLYIIASAFIKRLPNLCDYLSSRFDTIFIDEAQDLNSYQHYFINTIIDKCELKSVMIGDGYQSIYSFRGAKPNLFNNLPNKGYKRFDIDVSVRCHHSILAFSYSLFDDDKNYNIEDIRVYTQEIYNDHSRIKKCPSRLLVLVETRSSGKELLKFYTSNGINISYTESLPYDQNIILRKFKDDFMDLLEQSLLYYYNCNNSNKKFVYSTTEYKKNLTNMSLNIRLLKKKRIIKKNNESFIEFFTRIFSYFNIMIPKELLDEIKKLLEVDYHLKHYILCDFDKRIMTIHSSKGLEAENVLVVLEQEDYYRVKDETKRKYFVAFSRAKDNLIINYWKKAKNSKNREFIESKLTELRGRINNS